MKHFGDITKIHGWEVPIVDVVTGGSPCQDLSVAGKREGLAGERSGLFMEQVRLTKELREQDVRANGHLGIYVRPRYLVWENVTGAFSSNGGEDFRVVLEEICSIASATVNVPRPSGRWSKAGCIVGDGWSVAWRTVDNQFWGTPQRRRRIALVADFGSERAPEILFDREGVCRDSSEIRGKRSQVASVIEGHPYMADVGTDGKAGNVAKVLYRKTAHPQNSTQPQGWEEITSGVIDTLNTYDNTESRTPVLVIENHPHDSRVKFREDGVFQTLPTRMGTGGGNVQLLMERRNDNGSTHQVVRKLTVGECAMLQGFPRDWCDIGEWIDSSGKKHKDADSPKYKAIGNSIGLPFWNWLAERICAEYDHPIEMASLFDGIGGFPLVFQRNGCEPVWASEIEEFPMAVTKIRFPEGE